MRGQKSVADSAGHLDRKMVETLASWKGPHLADCWDRMTAEQMVVRLDIQWAGQRAQTSGSKKVDCLGLTMVEMMARMKADQTADC